MDPNYEKYYIPFLIWLILTVTFNQNSKSERHALRVSASYACVTEIYLHKILTHGYALDPTTSSFLATLLAVTIFFCFSKQKKTAPGAPKPGLLPQ